jgi:hypothetical protein
MEGAAARDAGWPNAGQSDLHEGEVGTIASPQAERLECVIRTRASGLIADVTATQNERAPEQRPPHAFDWLLVAVLSMTAGSVDLIGFLCIRRIVYRARYGKHSHPCRPFHNRGL